MVATAGVGDYEWWKYFIVPFMSGAVGWGTNVLALHMVRFITISLFKTRINTSYSLQVKKYLTSQINEI